MAIVSTRIEDGTKAEADEVANKIGIPLSTAINIFVKRFVAEQGFPFDVIATQSKKVPIVNVEKLDASVKEAVADPNNVGLSHQITYLDTETNKFVTISPRKE